MQLFTLRRLRAAVPFLAAFQRLQRKYMRSAVRVFGTGDTAPRLQALLFIRHMAAKLPAPATDQALKVTLRSALTPRCSLGFYRQCLCKK